MRVENENERRFAVRLAKVRRLRKMPQHQLAAECGLNRAIVAGIETDRRGVRLGEAVAFCRVLDVDLAAMLAVEPMSLHIEIPVD